MPTLSLQMKLTLKSRLWEAQSVTFDDDEQGFVVSTSDGIVHTDQFVELIGMGVFYHINLVSVSMGQTRVHFLLVDL